MAKKQNKEPPVFKDDPESNLNPTKSPTPENEEQ